MASTLKEWTDPEGSDDAGIVEIGPRLAVAKGGPAWQTPIRDMTPSRIGAVVLQVANAS